MRAAKVKSDLGGTMDLQSFACDEDVVQALKEKINEITTLNECRLYREEQLQFSEELIRFRNCIEWVIRANRVITDLKYALNKCIKFAESMKWPLEGTDNKKLYSYYLEDAVYRDIVLWDVYKQLLNEFFACGHAESDSISVFRFLKEQKSKIGSARVDRLLLYLNGVEHKNVRESLRNSFAHAVDATSSYVFHEQLNGKIVPNAENMFPNHPFDNISSVLTDVLQLLVFLNEIVTEMYEYSVANIMLLEVKMVMPCGKVLDDSDLWSHDRLREIYEQAIAPCDSRCENVHDYNGTSVCKPVSVKYNRIHDENGEISGEYTSTLTYEEMEVKFRA